MAKKTKNLADAIRRKLAKDPDLADAVEREKFNMNIASEIYALRTGAGLTQKQLADRISSQQSVIARLEDADYDGHSLKMLRKIAEAVGACLEVKFVTQQDQAAQAQLRTSKRSLGRANLGSQL